MACPGAWCFQAFERKMVGGLGWRRQEKGLMFFFLVDIGSKTHVVHYFSRYFLRCCGTLRMFSVFCFVFMPGAHSHADPYSSAFSIFRYYFADICALCKSPMPAIIDICIYLYLFAGSIYLHIVYMFYIYTLVSAGVSYAIPPKTAHFFASTWP